MTAALIIIPGLCYSLAAFMYAAKHQWALAIVYSGYAWANAGLWLLDQQMVK